MLHKSNNLETLKQSVAVVTISWLNLQLPVQSVHITTNVTEF